MLRHLIRSPVTLPQLSLVIIDFAPSLLHFIVLAHSFAFASCECAAEWTYSLILMSLESCRMGFTLRFCAAWDRNRRFLYALCVPLGDLGIQLFLTFFLHGLTRLRRSFRILPPVMRFSGHDRSA
ncbi:hypothetical protein DFP72DRAFT_868275, partial [Ephemerocybe angulata]